MSGNDKVILFLVLIGMMISFAAILAIVADKYKQAEKEKAEDQVADAEEIKQKILQMHDYGEFLNKELANKQNEAMLMYEMLLEKEKKLAGETVWLKNSAASVPAAEHSPGKTAAKASVFLSEDSLKARETAEDAAVKKGRSARREVEVFKPAAEKGMRREAVNDLLASASLAEVQPRQEEELINHNEEIKLLYSQGLPAGEIAERLQIGKGQVELVIHLFCT